MKTYDDKPILGIEWTKYKIVVPTEEDKKELMDAFEHLHLADVDTNFVTVNQLIHEYLDAERTGNEKTKNNIIVDKDLYEKLNK